MSFRGRFNRLRVDQQAVTTIGLTVLAWIGVVAVVAIVVALMGFVWW